jgi:hypothetical protein
MRFRVNKIVFYFLVKKLTVSSGRELRSDVSHAVNVVCYDGAGILRQREQDGPGSLGRSRNLGVFFSNIFSCYTFTQ